MTNSIQGLIDQKIAKDRDTKVRTRDNWSPSSLGRCYRFQIWTRQGAEPSNPLDARILRVFKAGDLFHEFVEAIITSQEPEAKREVECKNEWIKGTADLVLPDEVIDIKSIHSRAYHYMNKVNYDITKEKEPNWLQVACYAWILNKPKIRLVFVSKDDLCIREFEDLTKNWVHKIKVEIAKLNNYWTKQTAPAEPRCYGGKECNYCCYRDKCKG